MQVHKPKRKNREKKNVFNNKFLFEGTGENSFLTSTIVPDSFHSL